MVSHVPSFVQGTGVRTYKSTFVTCRELWEWPMCSAYERNFWTALITSTSGLIWRMVITIDVSDYKRLCERYRDIDLMDLK